MLVDVTEFEVVCPEHGSHKMLVPDRLPRPSRCPHCFLPLVRRVELRHFSAQAPIPGLASPEAWVG